VTSPVTLAALAQLLDLSQLALARIANLLDGQEWTADTLDAIANILRAEGFAIRNPGLTQAELHRADDPHCTCNDCVDHFKRSAR